jgi:hypothetical protein
MKTFTGAELLALPVRLHGIQLGRAAEVLLDRETMRAVGLDVLCGDEVHRFLPLPTALVADDEILIRSPLVLLEEDELDFYRSRTLQLSSLRGRAVEHRRRHSGTFVDAVIAADGELRSVIVDMNGKRTELAYDSAVGIAPKRRSAA